jgi:small subunit ribosomal protein S12
MATLQYLVRNGKIFKKRGLRRPALNFCPQKKGVCLKVYILPPKKPHSAKRKVARIGLSTRKQVICYIPGEGHNLQQHAMVLIRGGRVRDLPGVKYKMIRGKYDLHGIVKRQNARSKYGTKAWLIKMPRLKIKK